MALESWLASLKPNVTDVTHVTAITSKGLRCNVREKPNVTGVTESDFVTSVTSEKNQTLHRKPILGMAVTSVTSVTCEIINTDTQNDFTQPEAGLSKVESWLRQALDSIQPAKVLEAEGAQLGFTATELHTARAAIGARVVRCLGVEYWQVTE